MNTHGFWLLRCLTLTRRKQARKNSASLTHQHGLNSSAYLLNDLAVCSEEDETAATEETQSATLDCNGRFDATSDATHVSRERSHEVLVLSGTVARLSLVGTAQDISREFLCVLLVVCKYPVSHGSLHKQGLQSRL